MHTDGRLGRHVFDDPASAAEIRAFQEWEQRNAARMRLRYADLPVVTAFGIRPSDIVAANPEVTFDFTGNEPRLLDARGRFLGALAGTPAELVRRFVAALDGTRTLSAICAEQPFAAHAEFLQAMVGALLGGPFLLPVCVAELEGRLRAIELLRFPRQSPYAMPREYWENSIAVREALGGLYASLGDLRTFCDGLRGLHRLATIGTTRRNYYGGAGGVATVPGELRSIAIGNRFDERKQRLSREWLRLLGARVALLESGAVVSMNGVPFSHIEDGHTCRHAYGRAGEELAHQLNEVRVHLAAACRAPATERDVFLRQCALFHHAFAHAHPFGNINNSIAMNIVNDLLGRAGLGVVPHLYFDQVALFLPPADYVHVFELGVAAHVMSDEAGYDRPATTALLEMAAGNPRP